MPKRLKHVRREVLSCSWAEVNACERAFHREDVRHILQLLVKSDTSRGLLRFLHSKARIFVAEILVHLAQDEGEDAALARILLVVATVHEDILLARVAVKITVKD